MNKFIADLEQELVNLRQRYDLAIKNAQQLLVDAAKRPTSTHTGHNLASRASELSEIAAKIEQTTMILNDLKSRLRVAEQS
jgi:hypothetical protein